MAAEVKTHMVKVKLGEEHKYIEAMMSSSSYEEVATTTTEAIQDASPTVTESTQDATSTPKTTILPEEQRPSKQHTNTQRAHNTKRKEPHSGRFTNISAKRSQIISCCVWRKTIERLLLEHRTIMKATKDAENAFSTAGDERQKESILNEEHRKEILNTDSLMNAYDTLVSALPRDKISKTCVSFVETIQQDKRALSEDVLCKTCVSFVESMQQET